MQKELEFPASFCGLQEKKKKKHSERHGTCTHSSCYPLLWEGWQLHHSESKILKPILGSRAFFFSFLFTEEWKSGIRQTSQNSLYFPCCLCSRCCYPLRATHDPETLCCYFQYKISIEGLLDVLQCLFSTPAYMLFTKCKTNWTFELAATSERALVNTTLHVIVFKS